MNRIKTSLVLGLVVACVFFLSVSAAPNPDPSKQQLRSVPISDDYEEHLAAEFRQADDTPLVEEYDSNVSSLNSGSKAEASNGRLFLNKLSLFQNLLNANRPTIQPIIITGAGGTGTGTATGAGTALPATSITTIDNPTARSDVSADNNPDPNSSRLQSDDESVLPNALQSPERVDIHALQAAPAAGAQDYVVTDQEINGIPNSKASRPISFNLRPTGANKGQIIQVRISPKYRQYFKNGQKVMLNSGNRQYRRRIVRRRVKRNRRRVNNKQNRRSPFVAIG